VLLLRVFRNTFLEIANTFPKTSANVSNAPGSKDEQRNKCNQN